MSVGKSTSNIVLMFSLETASSFTFPQNWRKKCFLNPTAGALSSNFKRELTILGSSVRTIQALSRLPWNRWQKDMKRILVVDDNTEYLQVLSNVLSNDFDTIKATGVKDALDILQAITVDAICSDYNMKDGTGLGIARRHTSKRHHRALPAYVRG